MLIRKLDKPLMMNTCSKLYGQYFKSYLYPPWVGGWTTGGVGQFLHVGREWWGRGMGGRGVG
jgi:hypothetical protein